MRRLSEYKWLVVVVMLIGVISGCTKSKGYRDQVYHAIENGGEKSENNIRTMIGFNGIRLDEFYSSYNFDLPIKEHKIITPRLILGGSGGERERGAGYLMLALSAKQLNIEKIPPRHWVLAIDSSYSMKDGKKWKIMTAAVNRLLARLRSRDRVTIFMFGKKQTVLAENENPAKASAMFQKYLNNPSFSSDNHKDALITLGRYLLDSAANGQHADGFLVSDMEGASYDVLSRMSDLKNLGVRINVVGIAGGNEILLRNVARTSSGSYVFLADKSRIDSIFGKELSETFDSVVKNITASLWFDSNCILESADDIDDSRINRYNINVPKIDHLNIYKISALGPGEQWVKLWRIKNLNPDQLPKITVRVQAETTNGEKVFETASLYPQYFTPDNKTNNHKALLKAITIARQVQILRKALQDGYCYSSRTFAQTIAEIKAIAREVRDAQEILNDPEFARDIEALNTASKLTEAEVAQYRKNICFTRSHRLPLPFRVVGLPFVALNYLLFGK